MASLLACHCLHQGIFPLHSITVSVMISLFLSLTWHHCHHWCGNINIIASMGVMLSLSVKAPRHYCWHQHHADTMWLYIIIMVLVLASLPLWWHQHQHNCWSYHHDIGPGITASALASVPGLLQASVSQDTHHSISVAITRKNITA